MAKVFRTVGSLTQLLDELRKEKITFLDSVEEIIAFRNDFENRLFQTKEEVKKAVLLEMEALQQKLTESSAEYARRLKERETALAKEKDQIESQVNDYAVGRRNVFARLLYFYKRYMLQKRKRVLSVAFEEESRRPLRRLASSVSSTREELDHMKEHLDEIIGARTQSESKRLQTARFIIEENKTTLFGAIGEQKALNELRKLPDSFFIINDFQCEFRQALHKRDSGDWIRSIQADHLVIGPSGVFVIETKNWGSSSIQDLDLYSPVEQVKRTNYALFMLLNKTIDRNLLSSFSHPWGSRKIAINSILLMINQRPNQEFQHVKILTLDNLSRYITYPKPVLSQNEVEQLEVDPIS